MAADPFDIRGLLPDFPDRVERFRLASAAARLDPALQWADPIRYGADSAQEILLARPRGRVPAGGWPLQVFVHGGYWRAFEPRDYAFLARAICGLGAVAVLLGYRKMPHHRLGDLVADVRHGYAVALAAAPAWGGDPARATASGHSAGAHLAAFLAAARPGEVPPPDPPARLLLLSGLYDPTPLRGSILQSEIGLTEADCAWAPLRADPPPAEVMLVVGSAETAPFRDQARALASRWGAPLLTPEGEDHMSLVEALGTPGTSAHTALARTITAGGAGA